MTINLEPRGRIVETWQDGLPVLWTYVPEMPGEVSRRAIPWLTIVRWDYDGSGDNGMPHGDERQRMMLLEMALGNIESPAFCVEAYRRVGAGVREFVFYVADREKFLEAFNDEVAENPRLPIEIKFYKDEYWSDLQDLIDDFNAPSQPY